MGTLHSLLYRIVYVRSNLKHVISGSLPKHAHFSLQCVSTLSHWPLLCTSSHPSFIDIRPADASPLHITLSEALQLCLPPSLHTCNLNRLSSETGGLSGQTRPRPGVRPSPPSIHVPPKKSAEIWQHGSPLFLCRKYHPDPETARFKI